MYFFAWACVVKYNPNDFTTWTIPVVISRNSSPWKSYQHTLPHLKVILVPCHTSFIYIHKVNILRHFPYSTSAWPHFYLRIYPEICSAGGHALWQTESNIRGTGRKRSRGTWDLKTYPEYGKFLMGYTISGRKKSKSGSPVQIYRRCRVAFDLPPSVEK